MAVPRRRPRSAATAALLSFVFPGAGQVYTRRFRTAIAFALPAVVAALLLVSEISQGMTHFFARLLDPPVALTFVIATIALGFWRVVAVVHAWIAGRRTLLSWLAMPLLVVVIAGSHGLVALNAAAVLSAGDRMASGADSFFDDPPPTATPLPGAVVTPTSAPPTFDPSATLPPGADDYEEEYFPEPEPVINPGPAPDFDIVNIDTAADGLLNVLLVGIDWKPGRDHRLTDTMIVVSVNAETGAVYMFSFPRDIARFELYDGGTYSGKLNTFANFARRNAERYPDGPMESLSYQLGYLLGVPIDYYAAVDIPGFEAVVKAVGGVTIVNEKEINDLHTGFRLSVGEHRLNAEQTLLYVRSRKGSSDFARARRQQQVLAALRREMVRPERLGDLAGVIDAISQVLRTDFPRDKISELIKLSDRVDDETTNSWVFKYPEWSHHPPRSETNGRSIMMLRMELIEQLSIELFGEKSLYSP